jgi:regulator of sigma E protease
VSPGSPAAEAGLKAGDRIISLDGESVKNTAEAGREIRLNMGRTIDFEVEREDFGGGAEVIVVPVTARWAPPEGQGPTGIRIANLYPQFTETERYAVWEAIPKGWEATWESLILARNQVIAMFKGGAGPQVAGPVGIAQTTGQVVEEAGWQPLLELAALLSINLAIINMLPLPMLDGGRCVFVLLEVIRRGKRVDPHKEAIVHLVGLAFILTLAVVITYFDVARLISGGSLFE